jgi:ketosteroid isomerase-like protein
MKMRLLSTLAALAIGVAVPTLAEEQNSVDPEVRQQIEAVTKRREEAYNKHDAAAYARFYTQDAIDVWTWEPQGAAVGLPAIVKRYEAEFASYPAPQSFKVLRIYPIGDEISAVMEYKHHMHAKGHALVIYVRDADDWKVRLSYIN